MLVLSRNKGEKIVINNDIVLTILEVSGDHVRIGIDAPAHVTVYREEIYKALQDQNRSAATIQDNAQQLLSQVLKNKKNEK
ncbi:carbon storage regulator CsrA [Paenibacillus sp. VCA1]|uniref:carbon storage regulator CsrA n=1 Tax=Paenibacillus sp. VCA1 TaxID=3039148 RepID=UPI0028725B55|nr:carbon storage regulator CsrA [Paenibacillus sp. VCA1]MDR9853368.1 carbon storage regulator CsrA [Paenibacillus sp. VCA1]